MGCRSIKKIAHDEPFIRSCQFCIKLSLNLCNFDDLSPSPYVFVLSKFVLGC